MHQVGYLPGISARCTDNKTANFTVASDKHSPLNRYLPAKLYQAIRKRRAASTAK
jgi:hypothetical protein